MPILNKYIEEAYQVLETGVGIDRELAMHLIRVEGEDIIDLISLGNKVRHRHSKGTHACSIINAKSGVCPENCKFCAQSAHHNTKVEVYDLLNTEKILAEAKEAHHKGVSHFGIVTSGTGFSENDEDFQRILKTIDKIHEDIPNMKVCASLGVLSDGAAKLLSDRDLSHYNINLQVNPDRFEELISDTHGIEDKLSTIKALQKYGIGVCCGGIIGVAEEREDRVNMAFTLKELGVTVIPLNVLVPIKGTPLENQEAVSAAEIAKTFAVYRLINPSLVIKFAAGRETKMKDFQGLLMLSGANGLLTGGYLTTRGREIADDDKFISELEQFS